MNLRDQGYPSARSYVPNRSDKQNIPMTNSIGAQPFSGSWTMGTDPVQTTSVFDRLVNAYNNRAYANPKAPLIANYGVDYVDDVNDDRAYESGAALYSRNGDRLGFADKNVTTSGTTYNAGIDNLEPFFGDNYYYKEFNTPLGSLDLEYDGDGTFGSSVNVPSNAYYLVALKNLLNRGTL